MRLIDAEWTNEDNLTPRKKIQESVYYANGEVYECTHYFTDYEKGWNDAVDECRWRIYTDSKEVKAIPLEWIEKWNEEKCIKAINWLIEDWRKGNETD